MLVQKRAFQLNEFRAVLTLRGGDDNSEYDYDGEDSETEDEYDSDEDEYDSDEEEYDSDSDEEEEVSTALATNVKSKAKSKSQDDDDQDHDEPLALSPFQDMGVTLGVMVLCGKLDLTNAKIIKMARFAFIAYVVIAQLFLIYVRYKAKSINNTTPITIDNPISNLLQSQLSNGAEDGAGGRDMVKNIANSMLSSSSTIVDYDLQQAKAMNSGLLFPMAMLWFLHFKMGQVQPLFYQTANGFKQLVFSPLFQIYILGRNLERPFKNKRAEEMQKMMDARQDKDSNGDQSSVEEGTVEESHSDSDSDSDDYDEGEETDISDSDEDSDDTDSDEEEYDEYDESDGE